MSTNVFDFLYLTSFERQNYISTEIRNRKVFDHFNEVNTEKIP